jgi:uridylate kinase
MTTIISLGGSIVAPDAVDTAFLKNFVASIRSYVEKDPGRKVILIVGGGAPARIYQSAFREIAGPAAASADAQDWIGIMATRLNAELVKACFGEHCRDQVVTDPTAKEISFGGSILVAAGWKPGFSTDFDAVMLAERFGARTVINLSNVEKVYTADPRKDPSAKALDHIDWKSFRIMVGDSWEPGKSVPFDPIASKKASDLDLRVIVAAGRNIANLERILSGDSFVGTVIGRKQ